MSIQSCFDAVASRYDASRRLLIPCFDDFYGVAASLLPFANQEAITVLDLGAGTGLFTALLAESFPQATFTLVDVAGKMLAEARQRLATRGPRCTFLTADYRNHEFPERYDAIVSALSIHHLEPEEKSTLFGNVYRWLRPGGIFVNADQVAGETPAIDRRYREVWEQQVQERGIAAEEWQAAQERMKEDRMSPLSFQLAALRDAGFQEVNCWYQHYSFAVFSGRRQPPPFLSPAEC